MAAAHPVKGSVDINLAAPGCESHGNKRRALNAGQTMQINRKTLVHQLFRRRQGFNQPFYPQTFLLAVIRQ
jgi:hypothetical protein